LVGTPSEVPVETPSEAPIETPSEAPVETPSAVGRAASAGRDEKKRQAIPAWRARERGNT